MRSGAPGFGIHESTGMSITPGPPAISISGAAKKREANFYRFENRLSPRNGANIKRLTIEEAKMQLLRVSAEVSINGNESSIPTP